jgi:hypothetical protein
MHRQDGEWLCPVRETSGVWSGEKTFARLIHDEPS